MQENYKILGLSNNATDEEIEIAYKELKSKYSKERFLEGEVGNEAARNLTKLEVAYTEIMEERASYNKQEKGHTRNYNDISNLIKSGRIDDAQRVLDNEPLIALYAEEDGLDIYRKIFSQSKNIKHLFLLCKSEYTSINPQELTNALVIKYLKDYKSKDYK